MQWNQFENRRSFDESVGQNETSRLKSWHKHEDQQLLEWHWYTGPPRHRQPVRGIRIITGKFFSANYWNIGWLWKEQIEFWGRRHNTEHWHTQLNEQLIESLAAAVCFAESTETTRTNRRGNEEKHDRDEFVTKKENTNILITQTIDMDLTRIMRSIVCLSIWYSLNTLVATIYVFAVLLNYSSRSGMIDSKRKGSISRPFV